MNIDFSLVLAIVILVSGVIWAVDAWILAPKRGKVETTGAEGDKATGEHPIVEFSKFLFPVVLIVFLFVSTLG